MNFLPDMLTRLTRHLSTAVVLALVPLSAQGAPSADLGAKLAEGYVRPAITQLVQEADTLHKTLAAWCGQGGGAEGVPAVRQAFRDTVLAWSGVEFLRFGPLVQGNRYERLMFWPDTRGVVQRQVRALLAQADPAAIALHGLEARSVAVQGLPALEFVLYDEPGLIATPTQPVAPYACGYAVAVAANIAHVAQALRQAWSTQGDFGPQFTDPSAGNDLYRSAQEIAAEEVKALSTGLQFARDVKLLPVLGATPQAARAQRAAFWRSDLTLPALAASLQGLRAFYQAGSYHYGEGETWIGESVTGELEQAVQVISRTDASLARALNDPAGWQQLALVGLILNNAKTLVDQHVAPALGVTIGFNALDGD